jgi:hypothetical protein
MVLDVKPMVLPSRKVGGEFVCEIFIAGLLTQLDAGAPHNGKILGGGLWFEAKRKRKRSQWGSIPRKASQ